MKERGKGVKFRLIIEVIREIKICWSHRGRSETERNTEQHSTEQHRTALH